MNLFQRLEAKQTTGNSLNCLLLDTSASMSIQDVVMTDSVNETSATVTRIEALKLAIEGLKNRGGLPWYQFNSDCQPITNLDALRPKGSTNLTHAFEHIKRLGRSGAILVTDGEPNDEQGALDAARGLHLDIIYIGPGNIPEFLVTLARIAGGSAGALGLENPRLLAQKITGFLNAPTVL